MLKGHDMLLVCLMRKSGDRKEGVSASHTHTHTKCQVGEILQGCV